MRLFQKCCLSFIFGGAVAALSCSKSQQSPPEKSDNPATQNADVNATAVLTQGDDSKKSYNLTFPSLLPHDRHFSPA
jgi:hypothetical protein